MGLIFKCDRCGDIIPKDEIYTPHKNNRKYSVNRIGMDGYPSEVHMCAACHDAIVTFIDCKNVIFVGEHMPNKRCYNKIKNKVNEIKELLEVLKI